MYLLQRKPQYSPSIRRLVRTGLLHPCYRRQTTTDRRRIMIITELCNTVAKRSAKNVVKYFENVNTRFVFKNTYNKSVLYLWLLKPIIWLSEQRLPWQYRLMACRCRVYRTMCNWRRRQTVINVMDCDWDSVTTVQINDLLAICSWPRKSQQKGRCRW